MPDAAPHWSSRLPFYYGWLIVGIAFVTMAVGVTARTAFSLLMFGISRRFVAAHQFGSSRSLRRPITDIVEPT
jgi:hypothetical protein